MNSEEIKIRLVDTNVVTIYSNTCRMSNTPFDFQFDFSIQKAGNNEIIIENMCTILMSPEHAKVFAKFLNEKITEYESNNSAIKEIKLIKDDQNEK